MRYSLFKIANKLFAVDLNLVREVVTLPKVTSIPNVTLPFAGVFNLRGIIVPLLDFRAWLGVEPDNRFTMDTAIIIDYQKNMLGLVVEKVLDFISIEGGKVKSVSGPIPVQLHPILQGVYDYDALEQVYLLDIKKLYLSTEKI